MLEEYIEKELNTLDQKGLRRSLRTVQSAQGPKIVIDNKEYLNFCSNNYLGLADDDRLKKAAVDCIKRDGIGSGASRLVCGSMREHESLEREIAGFKGTESALVFNCGYMANVGIISGLFSKGDIIFSDRLNHASIIDGIILSRAELKRYPHCDMEGLEEMLRTSEKDKRKAIITDSVFSMDGDIAPLDKIVKLAKKYNCILMIDEAHAFGVMGKNGKGLAEHFELEKEIDIQMGTLSKAAGSFGAYCCGSKELIFFLINKARSFIYTTAMPPSVAAASRKAIEIIKDDRSLRDRLWDNVSYVSRALRKMGFNIMGSCTPIIPILLKDTGLSVEFSRRLFDEGILMSAIRPPTVPNKTARLRLTVMATHEKRDLDFLIEKLEEIGKRMKII